MRALSAIGGALLGAVSVYLIGAPLPPLVLAVMLMGGVSMIWKGRKE